MLHKLAIFAIVLSSLIILSAIGVVVAGTLTNWFSDVKQNENETPAIVQSALDGYFEVKNRHGFKYIQTWIDNIETSLGPIDEIPSCTNAQAYKKDDETNPTTSAQTSLSYDSLVQPPSNSFECAAQICDSIESCHGFSTTTTTKNDLVSQLIQFHKYEFDTGEEDPSYTTYFQNVYKNVYNEYDLHYSRKMTTVIPSWIDEVDSALFSRPECAGATKYYSGADDNINTNDYVDDNGETFDEDGTKYKKTSGSTVDSIGFNGDNNSMSACAALICDTMEDCVGFTANRKDDVDNHFFILNKVNSNNEILLKSSAGSARDAYVQKGDAELVSETTN